jgi:hypothetical protein
MVASIDREGPKMTSIAVCARTLGRKHAILSAVVSGLAFTTSLCGTLASSTPFAVGAPSGPGAAVS